MKIQQMELFWGWIEINRMLCNMKFEANATYLYNNWFGPTFWSTRWMWSSMRHLRLCNREKKIWIFIILICQIITNVWIASIKNLCRAKIKDEFWKMHLHSREENHGAVCKENFNSRVIFTCRTICINWKLWNVNSIKMRIFFVCLSRLYVFCLLISECKKFEQGVDLPWHLCLRSWNFQQKKNFFRMSKNSSVLWVRSQFA